ncbi:MAG: ATP synthase F1 subunit epsilon [Planctomycetes bacterium]|nr:ATP synthase F1 subunit epsilon [Planctomycetota bacterium]
MSATLQLEIVTPEAVFFSEEVEMVTLPGVDGQLGILPDHVALMTQMVPGEMTVQQGGRDRSLVVGEGLVEITGRRVSVLTILAIAAENIDAAKAEETRLQAEAKLRERLSSEEVASVNAVLIRSLAQLNVWQRHHS